MAIGMTTRRIDCVRHSMSKELVEEDSLAQQTLLLSDEHCIPTELMCTDDFQSRNVLYRYDVSRAHGCSMAQYRLRF
jgi:hypothetical protein